jgi:lipopolysaccharide/colanic/teichoic acid biosynthesis glycosyltransferase
VVVVADPDIAYDMGVELAGEPERRAVVVGQMSVEESADPARGSDQLVALVRGTRANVLVLGHDASSVEAVVGQAATVHEQGVRIRTVPMFYEEWLGKLPVSHLERLALMFDINEVHRTVYGRFRRLIDLPLAIAGCLALLVITPIVFVLNLFGNRGPLFYSQPRVGRQGHVFQIHKFRSMIPQSAEEAEEASSSNTWTSINDPRVTRFGRILRRTHVDELPQVINILKGELAVIGPRPEQPHYVEELSEKLPYYNLRHMVTPGLTGWAQVKAGYLAEGDDHIEKLQYEFFHLRHQRVGLDFRILLRTLRSVAGTQSPGR